MRCLEKGCTGFVNLKKKQSFRMGHHQTKPLCVCEKCNRIYTDKGNPMNDGETGYFVNEGVVVMKPSKIDRQKRR
jgi:non-ribosomal peptide synthetase component E (peptide arylation enzyme)